MATAEIKIELDGSGALETNVSPHAGDLVKTLSGAAPTSAKQFRVFKDVITNVAHQIVKRDGKGSSLGSIAGTEVQVIHEYVYVDPTTGVETYHVLGAINGGSYIYRWDGATTWSGQTLPITPTAGGKWFFCNAGNSVFAMNGIDALLIGIQTGPTTITWRTAGVDAPTFAPTYSLTTNNPSVSNLSTGFTVSCTQGVTTVTASGAGFTTGASWVGKKIVINGNYYTISSVTNTTHLELTEGFKETTASGLSWTVYPGVGDWGSVAPQYCFSYYNPTTGHCSLPSPVLQVTEQNQFGRTITLTIPGSAQNTTAYNNGYTQIQIFRSPANAGILVAINEKETNNNAGTAITFVETSTTFLDTYLIDLEPPTLTRKPPSGLSAMVFHQGRGWGIHKPSGTIRFTPLSVEVDFGVAVESWPALYKRDIPSIPRGLVVIGGDSSADSLVIQTARGDYSIDGADSTSFAPYRLTTRRTGGNLFGATDVDGNLVQFYADKRLFLMSTDLAQKIQNRLDSISDANVSKARLHWFSAKSRNFLLLSIPSSGGSSANDYTYVFNLDKDGDIYEWNFGVSALATVHDASTLALKLIVGDSTGATYQLLAGSTQDSGSNFAPTLRTSLLRWPEERAILKYVTLFVNDPQLTGPAGQERQTLWTGYVYLNEQTNTGATDGTAVAMTFRQKAYTKQSAQGNELTWNPSIGLRHLSKVFQLDITFPSVNAALLIDKIIIGFDVDQTVASQA